MDEDEFDDAVMNSLMQRFSRVGWITGSNMVSRTAFRFEYTKLGDSKLLELAALLKPKRAGDEAAAATAFLLAFPIFCEALQPPALSSPEKEYLIKLALRWDQVRPI